jgi:hypothetical protein
MNAATHFEQSTASAGQATALLTKLSGQPKLDDDPASHLRLIWNRSKHFDEDLINPNKTDADITAPVWLTNYGMSSTRASVTFDELHSLLSRRLRRLPQHEGEESFTLSAIQAQGS